MFQEAKEFSQLISGDLPAGWVDALPKPTPEDKGKATRLHSQDNLNAAASVLPGMRPPLAPFQLMVTTDAKA